MFGSFSTTSNYFSIMAHYLSNHYTWTIVVVMIGVVLVMLRLYLVTFAGLIVCLARSFVHLRKKSFKPQWLNAQFGINILLVYNSLFVYDIYHFLGEKRRKEKELAGTTLFCYCIFTDCSYTSFVWTRHSASFQPHQRRALFCGFFLQVLSDWTITTVRLLGPTGVDLRVAATRWVWH